MRTRYCSGGLCKSFVSVMPDPQEFQGCIAAYSVGLLVGYAIQMFFQASARFPFGGPADFTIFYTAAHIVRSGQRHGLYDLALQAKVQQSILLPYGGFMQNGLLPYNYPPFGALLFLPVSFLPLGCAFHTWNALNMGLTVALIALLVRSIRKSYSLRTFVTISLAVLSFYPVARVFGYGQSSLWVAFWVALSYFWLKGGKDLLSGMGLAAGLLKPQLVLTLLLVLLYRRRWRFVLGFAATASVLLGLSAILVGEKGLSSYLALLQSAISPDGFGAIAPVLMPNIRGTAARLTQALVPYFNAPLTSAGAAALTALLSLPVLAIVLWIWKGQWNTDSDRFQLQYAITIICSLLLSPHLGDHDLSLLVIVGFLASGYFSSRGNAKAGLLFICTGHLGYFLTVLFSENHVRAQIIQVLVLALAIPLIKQMRYASHPSGRTGMTSDQAWA